MGERPEHDAVPSTRAATGVPGHLLASVWRESAESGRPALALVSHDGLLIVGWVNRALSTLLGIDPSQLIGRSLRELADLDPEPLSGAGTLSHDLIEMLETLERLERLETLETLEMLETLGLVRSAATLNRLPVGWARLAHEYARAGSGRGVARLRHLDGKVGPAQVTVTPAPIRAVPPQSTATVTRAGTVDRLPAAKQPAGWLVTIEPVVDRLAELEISLSAAEHRFAALAEAAPVGIFASDAGMRLGYVNAHLVALTGRDMHSLLGTGWLDAVHREDLAAIYTAVQKVLAGTPVELAVRLATDDGRLRWLQLRLAPTTTPIRAAGFVGTAEDVTTRRSWEEHLTYQALHDPLTGLVNRRRLVDVLTEQLDARRDRDRDFAVLLLGLDEFKAINDRHGHEVGDRALIEVARRLQRVARGSDVLGRLGDDEFVVVLCNIGTKAQAETEAEAEAAVCRQLEALSAPIRIGRLELALSASIGVALPAEFDTPDGLLRTADRMMYEAKAAGNGMHRLVRTSANGEPQ